MDNSRKEFEEFARSLNLSLVRSATKPDEYAFCAQKAWRVWQYLESNERIKVDKEKLKALWKPRVEGQIRHTINIHPEWFFLKDEVAKNSCIRSLAKRIVGEIVAAMGSGLDRLSRAQHCASKDGHESLGASLSDSVGGGGCKSATSYEDTKVTLTPEQINHVENGGILHLWSHGIYDVGLVKNGEEFQLTASMNQANINIQGFLAHE